MTTSRKTACTGLKYIKVTLVTPEILVKTCLMYRSRIGTPEYQKFSIAKPVTKFWRRQHLFKAFRLMYNNITIP